MIKVFKDIYKKQNKFWNNCLFHPTDAIEDPWGKRILDRMAEDRSIRTVRIYTMFEDIVYIDDDGRLAYDFRLTDLRLDYLIEKGYDLLLAYAMMPECIALRKNAVTSVSKNKTRYKGKMINTSVPTDYSLWEEICYKYTAHLIERYGVESVSKWHLQCFNEPDIPLFFMSWLPNESAEIRAEEYCKLYKAFADGISKASDKLCIGGPALAGNLDFLRRLLMFTRDNGLKLDFISVHNYSGIGAWNLMHTDCGFSVERWMSDQERYIETIRECGFDNKEIIVDEWGMAGQGFYNIEECPKFIARDSEVFSAYYVKLIHEIIRKGWNISKLFICLSGQHEMTVDFSGFRNFFTMNFFAKPIYNAYVLASRLYDGMLHYSCDTDKVYVIPTKNEENHYRIILAYCDNGFDESIESITENITFEEKMNGRKAVIYRIDKDTTNPYRLYKKLNLSPDLSDGEIRMLRNEGTIKPSDSYCIKDAVSLELSPNSVYLIDIL